MLMPCVDGSNGSSAMACESIESLTFSGGMAASCLPYGQNHNAVVSVGLLGVGPVDRHRQPPRGSRSCPKDLANPEEVEDDRIPMLGKRGRSRHRNAMVG